METPVTVAKAKKRKVSREDSERDATGQRVPRSEALFRITRIDDATVRVELAKGWEFVLPRKVDEDPACLIMWDEDNVEATVNAMNAAAAAAGGGAAPPVWLNFPAGGGPMTIPHFKQAILTHVQTSCGGGGVIGNALIAPNTLIQYSNVKCLLGGIGFDPFFVANAVCPIGRHYVIADRQRNTTAVADPIPPPPSGLQGVGVLA